MIRAAGCIVWNRDRSQVVIVHRPNYDDWTFPKGKLDPGETEEIAAVREVHEETGYVVSLLPRSLDVSYLTAEGKPKRVRYFEASLESGEFTPNSEVDRIAWVDMPTARSMLTYEPDRNLATELIGDSC